MWFYFPMPDSDTISKPFRVLSVIASHTAGGIGPVSRYTAEGLARLAEWQVILLALHDSTSDMVEPETGLRVVGLGLDRNCARHFLKWLIANPQDLVITSDVSYLEPAFPFFHPSTCHVVQIHDSLRRYREVAARHAPWIDGVTCVGRHIENPLRKRLDEVGFKGLLRTVHNGACFPPQPDQIPNCGPLRLLFMGRVEALKGVYDFVPLLQRLKTLGVPVTLNIVGGENETLRRQFQRRGLAGSVEWTGRVPHKLCYKIAAESDIFLMVSRKEPFGMVTIEAMSMGCVPIAYDVPSGSTEIIEHGKSGLLIPLGDIRGWAEQIRRLHLDRKLLADLSNGAMKRSRSLFNAETMTTNMASFLKEVMTHAEHHPTQRKTGQPPEEPPASEQPARGYQRLPEGLRVWIRNRVCSSPRLSYWLLNR